MGHKVAVFSSKKYDERFLTRYNKNDAIALTFFESKLSRETVELANGFDAVCIFVNDEVDAFVLEKLASFNVNVIALRCAGFNNLDLQKAKALDIAVCRVPEYSPEAVAEHAVGLALTLSRKFHKAYNRVRENNFSLSGLRGFNFHNKTVGIIGTGKIGIATMRIFKGFGCKLVCYDPYQNEQAIALGAEYLDLTDLLQCADIISLHCPLMPQTQYMINKATLTQMKRGAMLINTSRGGLIDSEAVISALKDKQLGYLGLDVYELESELFFEDLSSEVIDDDVFQRLLTFPNVLITGHQGFFTEEALTTIAETTLGNLHQLFNKQPCENLL
ncbi:2-hydroxyacid dehydrogenase [Thalassotalea agarivorans]|uniref:D-lactate dehydrogenase n=1 Tax=Thalassotalea agarivorans TaxID=349064 RepID=A0A1I0E7B7_THASX|nr:2-hydroxyacid dehydrogenase [Thalassotalea agarivorans]SET40874.1 D-lactate dehydrogenase [Thalassotalea agarivorans]